MYNLGNYQVIKSYVRTFLQAKKKKTMSHDIRRFYIVLQVVLSFQKSMYCIFFRNEFTFRNYREELTHKIGL